MMKTLAEVEEAAGIQRKLLEKDIQKQCVDWWKRRKPGNWARKFSSISQRSVPDFLFGGFFGKAPKRLKFFTEFKNPDCKPKLIEKYGVYKMSTEAQYEEQLAMIEAGWIGFECNDFEKFKFEVERIEAVCCTGEV